MYYFEIYGGKNNFPTVLYEEMFVILIYFLIFEVNYSLEEKKSPDNYFNLCRRNDPDLDHCIQQAIMSGLPHLVKGVPEIKLQPIEPLYVKKMNMTEGYGNFKLSIILRDLRIYGFERMAVENLRINLTREPYISIKMDLVVPNVFAPGKYFMDGKILLIPLRGDGDFLMNATSVRAKCAFKGEIKPNLLDGRKYLTVDTFTVYLEPKGGTVSFTNLFGGNKMLGKAVNKFFHDRFPDIFDAIRHLPQRAFGSAFKDYVNVLFKNYPIDDLLLSDDMEKTENQNQRIKYRQI